MSWVVTINGVNRTSYVRPFDAVQIVNRVYEGSGTATIPIRDDTGALTIANEQSIKVEQNGVRLFEGLIRRVNRGDKGWSTGPRVYVLEAQDYSTLLDDDVIETAYRSTTESDKARITWLVSTFGTRGVTAGVEVQTLLATMPPGEDGRPEQDFSGKTLREAIEQIAKLGGGRYYVDYDKKLHYFATETIAAPYILSDTYNGSTSVGYWDLNLDDDSVDLVHEVLVVGGTPEGGSQIKVWRALLSASYSAAMLKTVPVAYWRLGEASGTVATDVMGAYNGTYVGTPTRGVAGLLTSDANTAVDFPGSDATYIESTALPALGTAYTLAVIVKPDVLNSGIALSPDVAARPYIRHTSDTILFGWNDASGVHTTLFVSPDIAPSGGRYFVVVTHDGSTARIYVNGVEVQSVAATAQSVASGTWYIGRYGLDGLPFDGVIDEPAIWNRALTATEIANQHTAGKGTLLPALGTRRRGVIRSDEITSTAQANAAGDAYLEQYGTARNSGSVMTRTPGFRAGQTVRISHTGHGLVEAPYIIAAVTAKTAGPDAVDFALELNDAALDLGDVIQGQRRTIDGLVQQTTEQGATLQELQSGGANLLANSSFESAITGTQWTLGTGWVAVTPPSGEAAYSLTKTARNIRAAATGGALDSRLVSVDRTADYWISLWSFLRSHSAGLAVISVLEYSATSTLLTTTVIATLSAAEAKWTRHTMRFGPNEQLGRRAFHLNTAFIRLQASISGTATLTWDVDGAQIERGTLLTAYAPSPQELVDGQIVGPEIADLAITETKIGPAAISTPKLQANAIEAGNIAAGAVTTIKLAANAVVAGKIAAGVITAAELAANAVTADKVAAGAITSAKIAADAIHAGHFGDIATLGVPNGGFEMDGRIDTTEGFVITGWNEHSGTLLSSASRNGLTAMRLRQRATGSSENVTSLWVTANGSRRVRARGWMRGISVNTANAEGAVIVEERNAAGTVTTGSVIYIVVGTSTTYVEQVRDVVLLADTVEARLILRQSPTSSTNNLVYFDDVELFYADMDTVHGEGKVVIDKVGVTITGGKLTVSNPGGTVVIDGTSDMFKIAVSGTISKLAVGAAIDAITTLGITVAGTTSTLAVIAAIGNQSTPGDRRSVGPFIVEEIRYVAESSGAAVTSRILALINFSEISNNYISTGNGVQQVALLVSNASGTTTIDRYARFYLLRESAI